MEASKEVPLTNEWARGAKKNGENYSDDNKIKGVWNTCRKCDSAQTYIQFGCCWVLTNQVNKKTQHKHLYDKQQCVAAQRKAKSQWPMQVWRHRNIHTHTLAALVGREVLLKGRGSAVQLWNSLGQKDTRHRSQTHTHTHMQKMPVTAAASGEMVRNCKMTKLSCLAVWDYEQLCAHSSLHALCMAQPSFVIQQVNILWLHLWISWWFSSTFSTHFLWATRSTFHTSSHVLWATLCARLVCLLATLFMYMCVCVFIYYIDMCEI